MPSETGTPVRVCLVAPVPPPYGGIANWTRLLTERARTDGRVVLDVIDTSSRLRSADGRGWNDRFLRQGIGMLRCARQLHQRVGDRRPEVLHVATAGQFGLVRDLLLLAIAQHHDIPSVLHIRFGRVPEIAASNTLEWRLMRAALRRSTVVMVLDQATERTVRDSVQTRVRRVPNPVDVDALPSATREAGETVVFLGWVTPSKGIGELLDAWAAVQPRYPEWRLLLAGPYDPRFRETLDPRGNVEFVGELPHAEALDLLAASSIVVLPSHTEGCPNVVIEAMALGRPVIATAVGAVPELLADGCGLVVTPRDTMALTEALDHLMRSAAARHVIGAAGRARVHAELTVDQILESYVATWHSLARRRRVAIVVPALRGGGAERVMVTLLRHLDTGRFDSRLVTVDNSGAYVALVPPHIEIVDLRSRRVRYALPRLVRQLNRFRPEVILSTLGYMNVAVLAVRPFLRGSPRVLVREANHPVWNVRALPGPMRGLVLHLYRVLYRRADLVIAQCDEMRQDLLAFLGCDAGRIRRIYNPVELDAVRAASLGSSPLDPACTNLLAVGSLTDQKGFDTLLRAMPLVRAHVPSARLTILGEGPLRADLERLARTLGITEAVSMPGFVPNPYPWFRNADVYVLSSRWEGLPNAVIEALACGTRVVATRCRTGPRELLRDGEFGELVDVADVAGLAEGILRSLAAPSRAGARAEDFDAGHISREYEEVLAL